MYIYPAAIQVFFSCHLYGFKFLNYSYLNISKETPKSELRNGVEQISHLKSIHPSFRNCLVKKLKYYNTKAYT